MTDQQKSSCTLCMLLPLIIGLLLLGGFWMSIGKSKAEHIQNDLSLKSNQLLTDNEVGGVIVTMDGRDATLTGTVASETRSQDIEDIVATQSGIRIVNNLLEIAAAEPVIEVEPEPELEHEPEPEVEVVLAPEPEPEIIEAPKEGIVEEKLQRKC